VHGTPTVFVNGKATARPNDLALALQVEALRLGLVKPAPQAAAHH